MRTMKSALIAASVGTLMAVMASSPASADLITGSYTIGQSGTATITNLLGGGTAPNFTENLTLGVVTGNLDFFSIKEPFSPLVTGTNNLTVNFTFTTPTGATGMLTATDAVVVTGSDGSATFTDNLNWSTNQLNVDFSNGERLEILLENTASSGSTTTYNGLKPAISFLETQTPVPEPLTLSLFGAGLVGAVALRRRNKNKA